MLEILEMYHALPGIAQVVLWAGIILLVLALIKRIVKLALFVAVVLVLIFVGVVLYSGV